MDYLEVGDFHGAFHAFQAERPLLAATGEGAEGQMYAWLLGTCAGTGQTSWQEIFEDPDIPLKMKTDLVFEIHEASTIAAKNVGQITE